ncbi:MAG TPA: glycosyltransferase [Bacteroidetes bacterium]|nr:glycosyltransferase [Bacteroidota bacterium]
MNAEQKNALKIENQSYPSSGKLKFSILVPTWNNLEMLKLCVKSIQKNSAYAHQVILHVNDGSDGTLEWAREQQIDHSFSPKNVGVCHAMNAAAKLATTDYIAFLNDDMYALPDWDKYLVEEIDGISHSRWFLSGTMIEPIFTKNACVLAPFDYGQEVSTFREAEILNEFAGLQKADWTGATWPPNVLPRSLWEEVGGYSEAFSPGMSSDPDFSMKLWKAGVRYFKGIGRSRVYHFQAKSTGKVVKNNGPKQFLQKWNLTQGSFSKFYLRRGKPWTGPLAEAGPFLPLFLAKLKSRFKNLF